MRYVTTRAGLAIPREVNVSHTVDGATRPEPKNDEEALQSLGEFFLIGEVTFQSAQHLSKLILREAMDSPSRKKRTFNLRINSVGGLATGAAMLAGTISQARERGILFNTVLMGGAYSAASIVLQLGDRRIAYAGSDVMIHDCHWGEYGNNRQHRDGMKSGEYTRNWMAQTYALNNTAGHTDPQFWLDEYLDGQDHYMTAHEALSLGLLDEVR